MAYTGINKSSDFFNTVLWNGNNSSTTHTVGFQPDFCWLKQREDDSYSPAVYDSVRGATKVIYTNDTSQEATDSDGLTAFVSNGFTLGSSNIVNRSGDTYVGWNWKAGTTSGINQDSASITPTAYSFNQTSGISIIHYTGTGSAATVPHGLGVTPNLILIKVLSGGNDNWTWKSDAGISGYTGFDKYMYLNNSGVGVATDSSNEFQHSPTATKFSLGTNGGVNGSGRRYVAYCFANKDGFSRVGGYVGTGDSEGAMVFTGFRPKFVLGHRLDSGDSYYMMDTTRDTFNVMNRRLFANSGDNENTSTDIMSCLSNGFKFHTSNAEVNDGGGVYVYWAFGQSLVGSNNVPCTAR